VDEDLFTDADGDGYFVDINEGASTCDDVYDNYDEDLEDCNDNNAAVNPGATEIICDNIDNDCDITTGVNGRTDDQDVYVVDEDNDKHFAENPSQTINEACALQGFVLDDCNDDPRDNGQNQNPHLTEVAFVRINQPGDANGPFGDGRDNDCDGLVDEDINEGVILSLESLGISGAEFSSSSSDRKRAVESSSSTSSHDRCVSNAVILVRLTNESPNAATNVIIKGALTLPKKRVTLPQYVFGDLVNYGVKVDEKSNRVAWVQFHLGGHQSQEIEIHICVDQLDSSSSSTSRSVDTSGIGLDLQVKSTDQLLLGGKTHLSI
jgi:hypothetical protein